VSFNSLLCKEEYSTYGCFSYGPPKQMLMELISERHGKKARVKWENTLSARIDEEITPSTLDTSYLRSIETKYSKIVDLY